MRLKSKLCNFPLLLVGGVKTNMNCTKCEISESCFSCQMGIGKKTAKIMFVADNPTEFENEKGKWMVGKAGNLFRDLLTQIGLDVETDCYFTGIVKCPTPSDDKGNQRQPLRDEIANCMPYFEAEMKIIDPDIIVPMGNVALKQILGYTGITKFRGKAVEKDGKIIFPILHPTQIFKQPKHSKNFTTDIMNLKVLIDEGMGFLEKSEVDYRYLETYEEVEDEIERLMESEWLVFDIETTGLNPFVKGSKIVCISLTDRTHYGVTIPLEHRQFKWPGMILDKIRGLLKQLLENHFIKKMGHNGKFDMKWLLYKYGIDVANYAFDPMIAHYITVSEERGGHGLKELAWELTDMGGYDNALDEYKKENGIVGNYDLIDWEILREYAAADVDCTMRLFKVFEPKILEHPKWPSLFELYMDGSYALRDMEINGAYIDQKKAQEFNEAYLTRISEIEEKLRQFPEIVLIEREKQRMFELRQLEMKKPKEERNPEVLKWNKYKNFKFSFSSPNQLRELLFDKLGLDTPFLTDKGKLKKKSELTIQDYSTGAETLEYLADKHPIAELLSEWRKLEKLYGTYIKPAYEDWVCEDELVHGNYNLVGCVTGDTLIRTNKGDVPICQLADFDLSKEGTFYDLLDSELEVFDGETYRKPLKAFYNGFKEVVTITTKETKKQITCTLNHRLGGINGWLIAGEIKEGDILIMFDEDDQAYNDIVESVERGKAETFDLSMDSYEQGTFESLNYTFNNGEKL